MWYQPSWIDEERATAARNKMEEDNIIYGGKDPNIVEWEAPVSFVAQSTLR